MTEPTLIFDLHGVLVDSEGILCDTIAGMLRERGASITAAEARLAFAGLSAAGRLALAREQLGITIGTDELQEEEDRRLKEALEPVRHVGWALDTLAPLPSCIAATARPERVDLCLELTGLDRFFPPERRFSITAVNEEKPSPALFLHAARQLGADRKLCMVIEDSPVGAAAARRAWMTPVGYAERGVGIDALVENGAIACSDMRSLPAMVQGIWNNHLRFQDNG